MYTKKNMHHRHIIRIWNKCYDFKFLIFFIVAIYQTNLILGARFDKWSLITGFEWQPLNELAFDSPGIIVVERKRFLLQWLVIAGKRMLAITEKGIQMTSFGWDW